MNRNLAAVGRASQRHLRQCRFPGMRSILVVHRTSEPYKASPGVVIGAVWSATPGLLQELNALLAECSRASAATMTAAHRRGRVPPRGFR